MLWLRRRRRYDDGKRRIKLSILRRFLGTVKGKHILDIGCGIGHVASMCAEQGAVTVAFDFAASMVARTAKRYGTKFPVIRASAESPPFGDNLFDAILALDVIEHLYKPEQMLQNAHRMLRPGGALIITTDRVGFQFGGLPVYVARPPRLLLHRFKALMGLASQESKYKTPLCTHVHEYRRRELLDLVTGSGFRLEGFDTYPNRSSYGIYGRVVEFMGRGPLRQHKWDYAIYKFVRP